MLPYLDTKSAFPPVSEALDEPCGLLAAGADLSVTRLMDAYSLGIFPWFSEGEPILWWSPNPRTVFLLDQYKPSKSLRRFMRQADLKITLNKAFVEVIQACSEPRKDHSGTWITDEIKQAYLKLHQLGRAHSLEVWSDKQLVGGIYGVSIGKLFCGESMFSKISNGSKVALACLIGYLKPKGFPIIDCQVENPHLLSLGALSIEREDYLTYLNHAKSKHVDQQFWRPKAIDLQSVINAV